MKFCLTNVFNLDLLRHLHRLVLVCVSISCSVIALAGGGGNNWNGQASVSVGKVNGTGEGIVYVSTNATASTGEVTATASIGNNNPNADFYLYASPADGYAFAGWFTNAAGTTSATINPQSGQADLVTITGSKENPNPANQSYYAKFEIPNYTLTLKASPFGKYQMTENKAGIPVVTPVDNQDVTITDLDDLNITLKVTETNTSYEFLRWVITKEGDEPKYLYNTAEGEQAHKVLGNTVISADFVAKSNALFIVNDDASKKYYKLSEAISMAVSSSTKTIVVHRSGTLYKETESNDYYDVNYNEYIIPRGITLLIPNGDTYTVHMGKVSGNEITTAAFAEKRYLIVDDEQDFVVSGDICIYANMVAGTGAIRQYGRLHLGNNSHIVLESGARLNAFGYVTGHTNSSVEVKSGATVQEIIQMADWRGGNAVSSMVMSDGHKVFPINQYYVQNIETNLKLHYGAVANVTSLVQVSSFNFPVSATFVSPKSNSYTGLFRLEDGSVMTRYYDASKDRVKYEITTAENVSESSMYFDAVTLSLEAEADGLGGIGASIILSTMGLSSIASDQYILPVNNNMDIHVENGMTVYVQNDIAFLAGSKLKIDKGAKGKTINGASVFIYDADQHHVQWTDATISHTLNGNDNSIIKDNYYNYFGSGSTPINRLPNRHGGFSYNRETEDLVPWINPNDNANTTKLQKTDATIVLNGSFEGAIYTTQGGASIISDDPTANATMKFVDMPTTTPTIKQAIQKAYNTTNGGDQSQEVAFAIIPINPSATLLNADNSYSAGGVATEENGTTYTYYPLWENENGSKGRWSAVLPQGEITPTELTGNSLEVTLPVEKTGVITFVSQAQDIQIISFDANKTTFSGGRFSTNGNATYKDGVVTIPIKYTPTTTHNDNITSDNAETVSVYFTCHNPYLGIDEQKLVTIPLTATQNYAPEFKINDKSDESITLNFATTVVGQTSEEQPIVVSTVDGNVTDRTKNSGKGYVTWTPETLSANSPFEVTAGNYFTGAKVVYKPTTTAGTTGGVHTQTLTLKATYSEGVEMTKTITLTGTPQTMPNPLQFVGDQEIYPGDVIKPLFNNMGNGTNITFKYNGEENSDIVELIPEDGNYKLQVKNGVNIVTQQQITIKATQFANDVTMDGSDEIVVTVTPSVQWNWSRLYFDNTYDNPIIVKNTDAPWSLIYNKDCAAIPEQNFTGDVTEGYQVEVGSGNEGVATFTFNQGSYTVTFSAEVYKNPRILDICMQDGHAARTFEDISVEKTNVKYDDGILFATTEQSGAAWTMALIGVPDKMEFVPQGQGKRWTIQEYDGTSWNTTYSESEISIPDGQEYFSHNLKPSTQQIRIICSLGGVQGRITDLCVYKLDGSASANIEKLYIPITMDEHNQVIQSQKGILLSYVSPESDLYLGVVDENDNNIADISMLGENLVDGRLPRTTIENIYREESITISSTHNVEDIVYLSVRDANNNIMLKLPIRLYYYPQPLPLRSEDWTGNDAEKYDFYVNEDRSQNVQFDQVTQKLTFSPSGSGQSYITFVYSGGPSYISFETQSEVTLQNWYDSWVLQVTADGDTYYSIAASSESEIQPEITNILRDGVTYYRVRVAIPYLAKSLTLQKRNTTTTIENVVIDGDADLDVELYNYTVEHTNKVNFTPEQKEQDVVVTAINLSNLKVVSTNNNFEVNVVGKEVSTSPVVLTQVDCPGALGGYFVGNITFNVTWKGNNAIDEGLLIFYDGDDNELATVRLLGTKSYILASNASSTRIHTGFADNITSHPFTSVFNENEKYKYEYREVDLSNTFADDETALFDYLIIYGVTSTIDNSNVVTAPTGANIVGGVAKGVGSNAKTPYYIYRKALGEDGVTYTRYQYICDVENANVSNKAALETQPLIPHAKDQNETKCFQLEAGEHLNVYVTGFCPYATTGYKKEQEGVWLFRGKPTAKLDLYLEDCHIYSRNKTELGCSEGKFDFNNTFQDDYARGSGGVFVFECNSEGEFAVPVSDAFQVKIHTRGENVLKSNYGSFYEIWGMRAYQVSSPIQIRLSSAQHVNRSRTHLTFDDLWPTNYVTKQIEGVDQIVLDSVRTNGFLSLQKLANNAPSIDLGNPLTVVNFKGGQIELQNAQNVSDKYKTTLAISYRSGIMAAGGVELQMAYGIGTDDAAKGTVNFYDGTITVIPMRVDESERKYYLMDPQIDQNGDTIKDANGEALDSEWTTCLRCPQNTYVRGGSICMIRACMSPTSKGGAPTDGYGEPLGRFIYEGSKLGLTFYNNDNVVPTEGASAEKWLVKPTKFPDDITLFAQLSKYYEGKYNYGLNSVTPDKNNNLTLWIPNGYADVKVEIDRKIVPWKACMTEIVAGMATYEGRVGGNIAVENIEDVNNLLYCHLDEYTHQVISSHTGEGDDIEYTYEAPVKKPDNFQMDGIALGDYFYLRPSLVGEAVYDITNEETYKINNKVYYITTALADTWMNFTMPFDVENIYIVESYPDYKLEAYFNELYEPYLNEISDVEPYNATRLLQGRHNADFAAFFGMAMALGTEDTFDKIKNDYLDWAYIQDSSDPNAGTRENYDMRGVYPLTHYDGSNFTTANFYLYENLGDWHVESHNEGEDTCFVTKWEIAPAKVANKLLHKGRTYSMLFPYCWGGGCDETIDDNTRAYWDYWTGKFLIFESTTASASHPHEIAGSNAVREEFNLNPDDGNGRITGNISFKKIQEGSRDDLFLYKSSRAGGTFVPMTQSGLINTIYPTNTILHANIPEVASVEMISRDGKVYYNRGTNNGSGDNSDPNNGTVTGGSVPTIGGGSDIFINPISGGINISVAKPQMVYVVNAMGAIIYNGYVQSDVDVSLPYNGIYVVKGETTVVKIFR